MNSPSSMIYVSRAWPRSSTFPTVIFRQANPPIRHNNTPGGERGGSSVAVSIRHRLCCPPHEPALRSQHGHVPFSLREALDHVPESQLIRHTNAAVKHSGFILFRRPASAKPFPLQYLVCCNVLRTFGTHSRNKQASACLECDGRLELTQNPVAFLPNWPTSHFRIFVIIWAGRQAFTILPISQK